MRNIKCFVVEETNRSRVFYRRYSHAECSGDKGYHQYKELIGTTENEDTINSAEIDLSKSNTCTCGYKFQSYDPCQRFLERLYVNPLTGEEYTKEELPVGAMFYIPHMEGFYPSPDGKVLAVITPAGEWVIDSRASNCTLPNDKKHNCWIRHGVPPKITVDKQGHTCRAGAGSILIGSYHGFLRNGELTNSPDHVEVK